MIGIARRLVCSRRVFILHIPECLRLPRFWRSLPLLCHDVVCLELSISALGDKALPAFFTDRCGFPSLLGFALFVYDSRESGNPLLYISDEACQRRKRNVRLLGGYLESSVRRLLDALFRLRVLCARRGSPARFSSRLPRASLLSLSLSRYALSVRLLGDSSASNRVANSPSVYP